MNSDQRLLVVGLYINSALYLGACMVFGWLTNHTGSWRSAIACAGICYLTYFAQIGGANRMPVVLLFALSLVTGLYAGLSLLW